MRPGIYSYGVARVRIAILLVCSCHERYIASIEGHDGSGVLPEVDFMIQTTLAINGEDCTFGNGNTPEEFEAIAVTLLRAAEAMRNREEGLVECVGENGEVIAFVHVHHCGPDCDDEQLKTAPTIEQLACVRERWPSLSSVSLSMIEQFRRQGLSSSKPS
jgi:hypothetical protein